MQCSIREVTWCLGSEVWALGFYRVNKDTGGPRNRRFWNECLTLVMQPRWLTLQCPTLFQEAPSRMLRVRMLSGEEVASLPVEEVSNVLELKRRLHQLHGLPPRFRQRLLLQGANLDDAHTFDSPLDLDLVLQPFSSVCQTQLDELLPAARDGSVGKAGYFHFQGRQVTIPGLTQAHITLGTK